MEAPHFNWEKIAVSGSLKNAPSRCRQLTQEGKCSSGSGCVYRPSVCARRPRSGLPPRAYAVYSDDAQECLKQKDSYFRRASCAESGGSVSRRLSAAERAALVQYLSAKERPRQPPEELQHFGRFYRTPTEEETKRGVARSARRRLLWESRQSAPPREGPSERPAVSPTPAKAGAVPPFAPRGGRPGARVRSLIRQFGGGGPYRAPQRQAREPEPQLPVPPFSARRSLQPQATPPSPAEHASAQSPELPESPPVEAGAPPFILSTAGQEPPNPEAAASSPTPAVQVRGRNKARRRAGR